MPIKVFVPNELIRAADFNQNFASVLALDEPRTVVVTHTWNARQQFLDGISVSGLLSAEADANVDGALTVVGRLAAPSLRLQESPIIELRASVENLAQWYTGGTGYNAIHIELGRAGNDVQIPGRLVIGAPEGALTEPGARLDVRGDLTVTGSITGSLAVANLSGVVPVASGGTGRSTLTTGTLMVGAGGSAPTLLAPGAAGGFVRSNGSAWVRATIGAADVPALDAAKITTGSFVVARIPNLPASQITSGSLALARIPNLPASQITSGVLDLARIPSIPTSQVTGVLPLAQVPSLPASRITSETFAVARIPGLPASQITSGEFAMARIPLLALDRIPNLPASRVTSGVFAAARIPDTLPNLIITGHFAMPGSATLTWSAFTKVTREIPAVTESNPYFFGVDVAGLLIGDNVMVTSNGPHVLTAWIGQNGQVTIMLRAGPAETAPSGTYTFSILVLRPI